MKATQSALIYRGSREPGTPGGVVTVARNGQILPLPLGDRVRNHSSSFSWGYRGSGSAQLAVALMSDYFGVTPEGDCLAEAFHQYFKEEALAGCDPYIREMMGSSIGEALVRIMVNDEQVGIQVVQALDAVFYAKWAKDHEGGEDLTNYDNDRISRWIDKQIREVLEAYLPLQRQTIGKRLSL